MQTTQGAIWIAWNIFLAFVPVALAYGAVVFARKEGKHRVSARILAGVLGLMWLVFMPNTCYLLTEWRHFLEMLGYTDLHLRWTYESDARLVLMALTLFYMCYSGVGVLTFTLAIRPIVRLAREWNLRLWIWAMPFFILMAIGVYLGLILRFNSWNMVNEFSAVWESVSELVQRPTLSSYIIFFAAFLWLMYLATDIWIDGFLRRFFRESDVMVE
jgi:uncharacterized membrane protein